MTDAQRTVTRVRHSATESNPPVATVALVSAIALGYEVLLMRLLSIVQWHHFAYMVISLALLGYGASGTFLSLMQDRLVPRFAVTFTSNVALFGLTMLAGFMAAQRIPFNPEEILWDTRQPFYLIAVYLLLAVPFFFAANTIALTFARFRDRIARIYAADLLGAGAGSIGIIWLLFELFPLNALAALGIAALIAFALGAWQVRLARVPRAAAIVLLIASAAALTAHSTLLVSPYKGLVQTLRVGGTEVIAERSSPLGYLSVVDSRQVPFRYAPGLSLMATAEPPPQLAVFTDADNMTAITRDNGAIDAFAYLDQTASALPYHLSEPRHVLVLGAGGGSEVQQARYHGAARVTGVEINQQMVDLVRRNYADFAGHLFERDGVRIHVGEARGFLTNSVEQYDVIQLALLDSFAASAAGLYALNESYLYTIEALRTYLNALTPGGYLAITRWVKAPPRDMLKLLATAAAALRREGVPEPGARLILIRNWQTSTLLVKNGAIGPAEIAALRRFAAERAFDLAWYPGIRPDEVNRFNLLPEPYYYNAAVALLGSSGETLLTEYKYNIRPATDDRPYFFHFFKWKSFPEVWALRARGGMPLIELGYLVLVATLLQALIASVLLIVFPLWVRAGWRRHAATHPGLGGRVLVYFSAIGLAFLFIEIAFIQKFILYLHHPLYAVAVVLASFLMFAGLGSRYAHRIVNGHRRRGAALAALVIAATALPYQVALESVFGLLSPLPAVAKAIAASLLIAPLAFAMGMPFPLAMARLGELESRLIPWAWGINGCASVVSAVLATMLAIHFGFRVVVLLAILLYLVAVWRFPSVSPAASAPVDVE